MTDAILQAFRLARLCCRCQDPLGGSLCRACEQALYAEADYWDEKAQSGNV